MGNGIVTMTIYNFFLLYLWFALYTKTYGKFVSFQRLTLADFT